MSAVRVFLGPTLALDDARAIAQLDYQPPAKRGEIHRAALDEVAAIGLIDGYYDAVPAVLHREILFALSRGIPVYGAASIGALRAAELEPCGMVGIGAIFEDYRAGRLTGDDEVALLHAPAELGYRPLVDALVNIRATMAQAVACGRLSANAADELIRSAKSKSFRERKFEELVEQAVRSGLIDIDAAPFIEWARANWVDQKATDARELIQRLAAGNLPKPEAPPFIETTQWRMALEDAELYLV